MQFPDETPFRVSGGATVWHLDRLYLIGLSLFLIISLTYGQEGTQSSTTASWSRSTNSRPMQSGFSTPLLENGQWVPHCRKPLLVQQTRLFPSVATVLARPLAMLASFTTLAGQPWLWTTRTKREKMAPWTSTSMSASPKSCGWTQILKSGLRYGLEPLPEKISLHMAFLCLNQGVYGEARCKARLHPLWCCASHSELKTNQWYHSACELSFRSWCLCIWIQCLSAPTTGNYTSCKEPHWITCWWSTQIVSWA